MIVVCIFLHAIDDNILCLLLFLTAFFPFQLQGFGQPSVYHAAIIIFFEFFAWGLLTTPMLTVSTTGSLDMVYMKYEALLKLFLYLDVNGFDLRT